MSAVKLAIRIAADTINWIIVAALLLLLLPMYLLDKAESLVKRTRSR